MTKIKSISTILLSEYTPEEGVRYSYEERDEQENIIQVIRYDAEGEVEQRIDRIFDNSGKLVEEQQFSINAGPDQIITNSYDEAGKVKQQKIRYLDGSHSFRNYTRDEAENSETVVILDDDNEEEGKEYHRFDSEGRMLEEIIEEEGTPVREQENSYDDYGRLLMKSGYYGDDFEFDFHYTYSLDEQGNVSGAEVKDEDGVLLSNESFKYDERGNMIEHRVENLKEGSLQIERWAYDMDNRIIRNWRANPDDSLLSEVQFRYGAHGLLEEEERLSPQGVSLIRYEYELF